MGMFDWFLPVPAVTCRQCGGVLAEWQGKDGPCGLFEWTQAYAAPTGQRVDDEVALSLGDREARRLPVLFSIHSICGRCQSSFRATCFCEEDRWTTLDLDPTDDLLPPGWALLSSDVAERRLVEKELVERELSPGHVLHGKPLVAIIRCQDDVLFRVHQAPMPYYLVHLTWRAESDPTWPHAIQLSDFAAFLAEVDRRGQ